MIRRQQVPDRIVGDKVVVARPGVDAAVVLGGAAALVWLELDNWMSVPQLVEAVARAHPGVDAAQRREMLEDALRMLDDEGLLEHRSD